MQGFGDASPHSPSRQVELAGPFRDLDLLAMGVFRPATRSAMMGSLPWKLIWTWHSPGIGQRGQLVAGQQHADVMRLL